MKYRSVIFLLMLSLIPAAATEYQIDKSQKNLVKFISKAPMENFEGVTDKIDGYLFWEGENMLEKSEIYFEVDLNSLDTGIGLRNRHMRENYLETEKYPFAQFTGKLTQTAPVAEGEYDVTAEGKMAIHGVEKTIAVDGKLTAVTDGYRVRANFIIPLSDYKIKIPQLMFFKIDENMKMELDIFLKPADKK